MSYHLMTVLLEYIDCFATTYHKCRNIAINEFYIMLALCLMLSVTHYAQNYAGIIGGALLSYVGTSVTLLTGTYIYSYHKCINFT